MLKAAATPVTGAVQYYVGKLTVKEGIGSQIRDEKYHTMSDFSSWGRSRHLGDEAGDHCSRGQHLLGQWFDCRRDLL